MYRALAPGAGGSYPSGPDEHWGRRIRDADGIHRAIHRESGDVDGGMWIEALDRPGCTLILSFQDADDEAR